MARVTSERSFGGTLLYGPEFAFSYIRMQKGTELVPLRLRDRRAGARMGTLIRRAQARYSSLRADGEEGRDRECRAAGGDEH